MAEYEVTWVETRTVTVRLSAPQNDERMLEAARTGELVRWAKADLQSGAVVGIGPMDDPHTEVTRLGRVVERPCGPNLMEQVVEPL